MDLGLNVTGINPSKFENEIFKKLNGFDPIPLFFEDVDFSLEKFDMVIMSHVLEHSMYPFEVLIKIRDSMQPYGVLAITIPNVNSFLIKIFKRRKILIFLQFLNTLLISQ